MPRVSFAILCSSGLVSVGLVISAACRHAGDRCFLYVSKAASGCQRMRTFPRPAIPSALALLALVAGTLGGCGPNEQFAPACPKLVLLPDAADITRFAPTGHDITDLVLSGRVTAVPASCKWDGRTKVAAELSVTADLTRGPAAKTRTASVRYFVTVLQGDRILDQQDEVLSTVFPNNIDRVSVSGEPIELSLPVTPQRSAAAYQIVVGLRLTPEELAYNRRHSPQ